MPIRLLTPADAPAYIAIRREMLVEAPWAFASSPEDDSALDPAEFVARVARPGQAIFGAFDEGALPAATPRLLGTVGVYRLDRLKTAHRAGIRGVYVTPAARNRGLATALLTAALDLARSWPGVTTIGLSVSERSAAAVRVYERVGFRVWGREPRALIVGGHGFDEIHMTATLGPS